MSWFIQSVASITMINDDFFTLDFLLSTLDFLLSTLDFELY